MLYLILMKNKLSLKTLPLGISLLRVFYAVNALLLLLTSLMFFDYLDVIILGKVMPAIMAVTIRLILVIFPLYLALGFSFLRKDAYRSALIYQFLFIINAVTIIFSHASANLKIKPVFEITIKPDYNTNRIGDLIGSSSQLYIVQTLSIIIGASIIFYLFNKRKLFTG